MDFFSGQCAVGRSLPVDFFSGQCAVGRSLPVASSSPGLLLPLLDFFCLSGLLLPLLDFFCRCALLGAAPKKTLVFWWSPPLLVVVGPSLLLLPALLGAAGKTKTNSVLPPVSLLGDQWTHAPANACVCGLLHRPPSSSPSPFIPVGTTPRTGDTPQTPLPTRPSVVRAQVSYRYLTFPIVFSVVLANSRVSIAGSSCATLRLLSPSACSWGGEAPTPFTFS